MAAVTPRTASCVPTLLHTRASVSTVAGNRPPLLPLLTFLPLPPLPSLPPFRQALASVQSGWISATSVRTITLLGKRDPGAGKAFGLLVLFSTVLVAISCVPLLVWPEGISSAMTNDGQVG